MEGCGVDFVACVVANLGLATAFVDRLRLLCQNTTTATTRRFCHLGIALRLPLWAAKTGSDGGSLKGLIRSQSILQSHQLYTKAEGPRRASCERQRACERGRPDALNEVFCRPRYGSQGRGVPAESNRRHCSAAA